MPLQVELLDAEGQRLSLLRRESDGQFSRSDLYA